MKYLISIAFLVVLMADAQAKIKTQIIEYKQGDAVHGFSNSANGTDNSKGLAYNEKADRRSWEVMKYFFREIFK